ncbi:MAG TPA: hypothetical protein VMV87_09415 [Burkholderiales bacterium]|nr:hypothetical protein [Burkholderiales bacterium]
MPYIYDTVKLVKQGHIEQAHRLRHQLSRVFRFAVATERASRDPAADLRDTLPSRNPQNPEALERQLSHKEPGVVGVYNKAQHLPERRKIMQAWADYLDMLKTGRAASAVGMKV